MDFSPRFLTTVAGSFPHADTRAVSAALARRVAIPAWPQMVRRNFRENMYVQYSAPLPGIVLDAAHERVFFDTNQDLTPALEGFYERYLADDLDAFGLSPEYAAGFFALQAALAGGEAGEWVKGQVTGPVSFGLTVTDQDRRASLYDETLADAIVKNAAMNARWQVRRLRAVRPKVIIFVDEPYMAQFGSAYISLGREQVTGMLGEVFDGIHAEGGLAGVHCCGNTDWSVLLDTPVDILNLDAYGYLESLALYPAELRAFLDRGGVVAWGIVPNTVQIWEVTPEGLAGRLRQGLEKISERARGRGIEISVDELAGRSLISPQCGLGPATPEIADRSLDVLVEVGELL